MIFEEYLEGIVRAEILKLIEDRGYALETEFCSALSKEHKVSKSAIQIALFKIYPALSLRRRRLNDDLKRYLGLKNKGCPIVYLPMETDCCQVYDIS